MKSYWILGGLIVIYLIHQCRLPNLYISGRLLQVSATRNVTRGNISFFPTSADYRPRSFFTLSWNLEDRIAGNGRIFPIMLAEMDVYRPFIKHAERDDQAGYSPQILFALQWWPAGYRTTQWSPGKFVTNYGGYSGERKLPLSFQMSYSIKSLPDDRPVGGIRGDCFNSTHTNKIIYDNISHAS